MSVLARTTEARTVAGRAIRTLDDDASTASQRVFARKQLLEIADDADRLPGAVKALRDIDAEARGEGYSYAYAADFAEFVRARIAPVLHDARGQ